MKNPWKISKISKKVFAPFFIGIFMVTLIPTTANAFELQSAQEFTLQKGEQINQDLYIGGEYISIAGNVLGDIFAGGEKVFLSGTTTEDVNAAGSKVTFTGKTLDDLRLAGGDVVVSGVASSSAMLFGSMVHITPEATIGGDTLIAGSEVRGEGEVSGDLTVYGGQVSLNGTTSGDVEIHAGEIKIGPDATISGDLTYFSATKAQIAEGAVIAGAVHFEQSKASAGGSMASLTGLLSGFLTLLFGALVFGLGLKGFSNRVLHRGMSKSTWKYFLLGIAFTVIVPFLVFFLFLTIIGMPLAFILLFAYIIFLIAAWFYSAVLLGSALFGWAKKKPDYQVTWQGILLGAILMTLLSFIPIVGWVIQVVLTFIALGSLLYVGGKGFKRLR